MKTVQISNGLRIAYREQHQGDDVVLFIHGNVASSLWWERVWPLLPANLRLVAPDLRGCGDSDKPESAWSMADLADDIYRFTVATGIHRCAVVGHSLGGGVALQLAVDHPELVSRLMLINSAPAEGLRTPADRFAQLEAVVAMPEVLQSALAAMMPTAPKDDFYMELLAESVAKSAGAMVRNGRALDVMNLTEAVRAIQVPVLLLYGEQDGLVTLEMMQRTQAAIPGAALELWPDVGHSAPVEAPERFTARLAKFLAG